MSADDSMTDEEFLEERRIALKQSVDYFRSQYKAERECWVCREFIENLGLQFEDAEVVAKTDDPPDIVFRGASFEIKEVLDPGRRRHAEYKEALQFAMQATNPQDLLEDYSPIDITPIQIGDLLIEKLTDLEDRYHATLRSTLDLLFYVNLKNHYLTKGPMPSSEKFSSFSWRSVSALFGWGALVFHASSTSPNFIKVKEGELTLRQFD